MYAGRPASQPVILLGNSAQREASGHKAQLSNIGAAKAVASVIRSTLGPKAMLKMLLDPMGGITITNDGNAILREIDVSHPSAKSLLEICRTQDEEVGDGTTSVIVICGEMLSVLEPLLSEQKIHPTILSKSYLSAVDIVSKILESDQLSLPVGEGQMDPSKLSDFVRSTIDTKFVCRWGKLISDLAVEATLKVCWKNPDNGKMEIDLKRFARVEKIAGGELTDSRVLDGVMVNKDVTHGRMRRRIENPRVVLLDCTLEYKKGESQTNIEITADTDWAAILAQEEEEVRKMCDEIIRVKPDVVITEKGVSDLAQHFLMKKNISVLRRVRKTDNNRIARVTGATICNRCEEITEEDVGTLCSVFEVSKIGDEYYSYFYENSQNKSPTLKNACTVLLRGGTKDVLNEIERNLQDAFSVARNIILNPRVCVGGGGVEMAMSVHLNKYAEEKLSGREQVVIKALATAFEVIPRTLVKNCGGDVVRTMSKLRQKHFDAMNTKSPCPYGIDGATGNVAEVIELKIMDPVAVKNQAYKTAIETSAMLIRIDDICSGMSKPKEAAGAPARKSQFEVEKEKQAQFGDSRDG